MVKIERNPVPPPSLAVEKQKATGVYNKSDVILRLKEDSHDKCYICELGGLSDPEVEHLKPHHGRTIPERVFDWNNLFWACGHCNGVKNQRKYDDHIIDCCNSDPEERIWFRLNDGKTDVVAVDESDLDAEKTAQLVTEVFNLKNTGMRVYKSDFRFKELNKEMNKMLDVLDELAQNPDSIFEQKKLKALIRKESRFAAFKRCYIRENVPQYIDFL